MANMRERNVAVDKSASGDNELVAAVAGAIIRVVHMALVPAEAVTVKFKSGAATDLTGAMAWAANALFVDDSNWENHGLFSTAVGQALVMNLGAAKQVGGYIRVQIIPVTASYLA